MSYFLLSNFSEMCLDNAISFFREISVCGRRAEYKEIALQLVPLCLELKRTRSRRVFETKIRKATELLHRLTFSGDTWGIFYGLLLKCFLKRLNNSDTIGGILKCLDGDYDACVRRMTDFVSFKTKLRSTVTEKSQRSGLPPPCFVSYVLHHANECRVMVNGGRFVSMTDFTLDPRSRHVQSGLRRMSASGAMFNTNKYWASTLLLLLQYGGRLSDRRKVSHRYVPPFLVDMLSGIIKLGANEELWDEITLDLQVENPSLVMSHKMRDVCASLVILLKDTRNPHEVTFYLPGQIGIRGHRYCRIPNLDSLIPLYDALFPNSLYGRNRPSSLCHMCRFIIRITLYDSWNLPDGIQSLPIPGLLKDYLNLLHD